MKKLLITFISLALIICTLSSCMAFMPGEYTGIFGPDKCNHDFGEWSVVKAATCTSDGAKKRECSICGDIESKQIVMKNHTYFGGACTYCGIKSPNADNGSECNHIFGEWESFFKSTCQQEGRLKRTCSICGEASYKRIEKVSHSYTNGVCIYCNIQDPEYIPPLYTEREFFEVNDVVYVMGISGAGNLRTETNFNDSSKGISVKNYTELKRTGVDSKWSKVEYEGKTYYVSNNVIVEKEKLDGFEEVNKKIEITTAYINVRFVAFRTTDDPLTSFKKGDIVEVVGFNKDIGEEGWYKVKLEVSKYQPHEYGYISAHPDYSKVIGDNDASV